MVISLTDTHISEISIVQADLGCREDSDFICQELNSRYGDTDAARYHRLVQLERQGICRRTQIPPISLVVSRPSYVEWRFMLRATPVVGICRELPGLRHVHGPNNRKLMNVGRSIPINNPFNL